MLERLSCHYDSQVMRHVLVLIALLLAIVCSTVAVASPGDNPQRRGYDTNAPP